MGMGVQGQALAALPMRRTPRSPLQERLDEFQGRSGWVCTRENLSTPLGFVPQTVQHVASPYTKCTILAPTSGSTYIYIWKMIWHLQKLSQKMSLPVSLWYNKTCAKGNIIPPGPYVTGNMYMSCMHANSNFSYSSELLTITITMNAKHEFL